MKLEVGKNYKIILKINEAILTYDCWITEVDGNFISFIDKYDKEYTYNINTIISFEEIKNA